MNGEILSIETAEKIAKLEKENKKLTLENERHKDIINKIEYWLLNEAILEFYNNKLPIELVIENGLNRLKEWKSNEIK